MDLTEQERRLLALHYVYPVPWNRLKRLFETDPTLEKLHAYRSGQLADLLDMPFQKAERLKDKLRQHKTIPFDKLYERENITPIPFTHPSYPDSLQNLIDPPAVLYTKGDWTILRKSPKIAIIGSRKATNYSLEALSTIVPPLVEHEMVIVSGLAKGADAMAHEAALAYGGHTIAVLGHGLFHLYPKENEHLAKRMEKEQLLITEYPPYVRPAKWTFPMRNRIISGLSDAIIVTESTEKSGTMSTVIHALDHGKDIFAVPGPITSALSLGPNRLLHEGAQPLWNGFQVVGSLVSDR
ncbi:DNA-processing protein DprA [Sporosarcina sp. 179-K 3D1 HS]|uniref:DNA-processing protein DprA n=1 Tax=Sporosarcina sp. 179-K 3D1 HS TaxID=3232169 RepID=UPI0039A3C4E2